MLSLALSDHDMYILPSSETAMSRDSLILTVVVTGTGLGVNSTALAVGGIPIRTENALNSSNAAIDKLNTLFTEFALYIISLNTSNTF